MTSDVDSSSNRLSSASICWGGRVPLSQLDNVLPEIRMVLATSPSRSCAPLAVRRRPQRELSRFVERGRLGFIAGGLLLQFRRGLGEQVFGKFRDFLAD